MATTALITPYQGQALRTVLTSLNDRTAEVMDTMATWQHLPAGLGKYGLERFVSSVKISDIYYNREYYVHYENDYLYDEEDVRWKPEYQQNIMNLAESYDAQAVRGEYGELKSTFFFPLILADMPSVDTGQPLLLIADFKQWIAAKYLMARGWKKVPAVVFDGLSPFDVVNHALHWRALTGGVAKSEMWRAWLQCQYLPGNPDSPKRGTDVEVVRKFGLDRTTAVKLNPVYEDPITNALVRDHRIQVRVAIKAHESLDDETLRTQVVQEIADQQMDTTAAEKFIEHMKKKAASLGGATPHKQLPAPKQTTPAPTATASAPSSAYTPPSPPQQPEAEEDYEDEETESEPLAQIYEHISAAFTIARQNQGDVKGYMGDNVDMFMDNLYKLKKYLESLGF